MFSINPYKSGMLIDFSSSAKACEYLRKKIHKLALEQVMLQPKQLSLVKEQTLEMCKHAVERSIFLITDVQNQFVNDVVAYMTSRNSHPLLQRFLRRCMERKLDRSVMEES